jgi:hypothetical protein
VVRWRGLIASSKPDGVSPVGATYPAPAAGAWGRAFIGGRGRFFRCCVAGGQSAAAVRFVGRTPRESKPGASIIDPLVDRLELFNRKVEKLASFSLYEHVTSKQTTARVHWERNRGWDAVFDGPGAEALDATVLTLRQFMQDNDPVSLANMRRAYQDPRITPDIRDAFCDTTGKLNAFLDLDTNLAVEASRKLTNRDVLNIFVYGGLAHSSSKYRTMFESMASTPFFPILQVDFVNTVGTFVTALRHMANVNRQALEALAASGGA